VNRVDRSMSVIPGRTRLGFAGVRESREKHVTDRVCSLSDGGKPLPRWQTWSEPLEDGAQRQHLAWPTAQENLRLISPVAATSNIENFENHGS
jgi:hypothetical protein